MRKNEINFYAQQALNAMQTLAGNNLRLFANLSYDESIIARYRAAALEDGYSGTDFNGAYERLRDQSSVTQQMCP